jgi:hypothetical protein
MRGSASGSPPDRNRDQEANGAELQQQQRERPVAGLVQRREQEESDEAIEKCGAGPLCIGNGFGFDGATQLR